MLWWLFPRSRPSDISFAPVILALEGGCTATFQAPDFATRRFWLLLATVGGQCTGPPTSTTGSSQLKQPDKHELASLASFIFVIWAGFPSALGSEVFGFRIILQKSWTISSGAAWKETAGA